MADPTPPGADPADPVAPVCPWCSAPLAAADETTCSSCGAILSSGEQPDLPGLTAVDPRSFSSQKLERSRNKLLSWISGDYPPDETATPADAQAVAPPDAEVRREIRRLELEAEVANLQAEADAILSEAAADGRVMDVPEGLQTLASTGGVSEALEVAEAEVAADAEDAKPDAAPRDTNAPPA